MAKAATPASTEVATRETSVSQQALAQVMQSGNGRRFVAVRQLRRPALTWKEGETILIKFLQPISPPERDPETNKIKVTNGMQSPWTAIVEDQDDGQEKDLVLNMLFANNVQKSYPDDSYVGKYFAALKLPKPDKKRYHEIELVEVAMQG